MSSSVRPIDPRLVSLSQPACLEAEQYQTLRLNLQRIGASRPVQMIAITSPTSGDGKTLTAINLAGALARGADTRVLLIEADLRRPSMAKQFGIPGSAIGLADIVLNPVLTLDAAARRLDFGFSVITAGSSFAAVHEVFNSPRFKALLDEAREHYDYVALDTPPILPVSDCRLLAPWVDGLLLVVSAHRTPRKLVEESLNLLDRASVLGIVFNQDDHALFSYHRRRYYRSYAPAMSHA
jgi:capsular exopolysaccharide synthesis family protein